MSKTRWLLAIPLALAASLAPGGVDAASVRDTAGMFGAEAVKQADAELERVETRYNLPVTIETIESLKGQDIADVSLEMAKRSGSRGLFVLLSKRDNRIYERVSSGYDTALGGPRLKAIRAAFIAEFKKGDFDGGLLQGTKAIDSQVSEAVAESGPLKPRAVGAGNANVGRRAGVPPAAARPGFGLGSLLGIGILIMGVLFVVRLIGSLFGGARGGMPGRMGAPGYGPGGYGGGGGGGGFMSSVFGGLGGALAGNWIYDQFSGRHGGGYTSGGMGGDAGQAPAGGDEWSAGTGDGGGWGGGGDAGGGGDWGGGGGGGGGDWGGGGGSGGGDW